MGEEGFSSDSSLLYHRGVPSAIVDSQVWELPDQSRTPNHPLKPRHLKLHGLFPEPGEGRGSMPRRGPPPGPRQQRRPHQLRRHRHRPLPDLPQRDRRRVRLRPGGLRHRRDGLRRAVLPHRRLRAGPAGDRPPLGARRAAGSTRSRPTPTSRRPSATCRASGSCSSTRRTASATCTAPASRTSSRAPTSRCWSSTASATCPVGVGGSRLTYATHPFDVVGWDGCLYPHTFNVEDYMPITGKVHQPPPVHQVFEGHNFVVCNFVPAQGRLPPAGDPGALLPLQRRLRRGDVLRRRRLRGAQGLGHQHRLDLPAPRRPRARPPAERDRGVPGCRGSSTSSRS